MIKVSSTMDITPCEVVVIVCDNNRDDCANREIYFGTF